MIITPHQTHYTATHRLPHGSTVTFTGRTRMSAAAKLFKWMGVYYA